MSDTILAAIIAAVTGFAVAFIAVLPSVRRGLRHRRQVDDVILGVEKSPGVEERPSLVHRVNSLEATVEAGIAISQSNGSAVEALAVSHSALATTLRDHMQSEDATNTHVQAALVDLRATLADHAAEDVRTTEEVRQIASKVAVHAASAAAAARSAEEAATMTRDALASISAAVGAKPKTPTTRRKPLPKGAP